MNTATRRKPKRTGLAKSRVCHITSSRNRSTHGIRTLKKTVLCPKKIAEYAAATGQRREARMKAMNHEEKRALLTLCGDTDAYDEMDVDFGDAYREVVSGDQQLEISHAGGEFFELTKQFLKAMQSRRKRRTRKDYRTRRDRARLRALAFEHQLPAAAEAYLTWSLYRSQHGHKGFFEEFAGSYSHAADGCTSKITISVVDIFRTVDTTFLLFPSDPYVVPAVVRHGAVPSSPIKLSQAFTIDVLELFRVARNRNPHFSIQAFMKTLCDLQGIAFRPYFARQFTVAFDQYLQILRRVKGLTLTAIRRDDPLWRLKNRCPTCTYTLEGEPELQFSMLYTMDGNDSLKRAVRQQSEDINGSSETTPLNSSAMDEILPGQVLDCDRYLSRDEVDAFAENDSDIDLHEEDKEDTPCASCWKNMQDQHTAKTWGVFDETGVFMAVCRHGFSLVIADMVCSGERAKYPLAVVSRLLDAFGRGLGGGYDIGCKFKKSLSRSSLGERARSLGHTSLVGSFHGHAHGRLCQLDHLTTYVTGLGLEDLEGCERAFSKSNALASSVRYAGSFHRRQAISNYFEHNDEYDVYANLSTFLYNNYRQALNLLEDAQEQLPKLMSELNISDHSVFSMWLSEEHAYLLSRKKEPEEETAQMTYWEKLVALASSEERLKATNSWTVITPTTTADAIGRDASNTARLETARRHAQENYDRDLAVVQELELKLGIATHWTPEDELWQNARQLVAQRKYRQALATLEGLVVARIFELGKMNRAGTGYKLRKHIGKALQARSSAIKSALERYNAAARALSPPRRMLTFDEVVEYAFLADFELLQDAREDISKRPWATPTARAAMDMYFKMCRAQEEIIRLNIEIRRFITYLWDEDRYLLGCEEKLRSSHPGLAHQVGILRNGRGRFNRLHLTRLREITRLSGFSGTLTIGKSTKAAQAGSPAGSIQVIPPTFTTTYELLEIPLDEATPEELDEEQEEEDMSAECSRALEDLILVTSGL